MPDEKKTKTLMVKFQDHRGEPQKITVPAGAKITFGPLCPGAKHDNGEKATALRIYESSSDKSTQLACFVRVESFYEIEQVSCIKKRTKRASKVQSYEDGGVQKNRTVQVEVSEWKNELDEEEVETEQAQEVFGKLKDKHSSDDDD